MFLDFVKVPWSKDDLRDRICNQDANGRFGPSEPEALCKAVDLCENRAWIHTLTKADCEADRIRWRGIDNESATAAAYVPGWVDYTMAGYHLCTQVDRALRSVVELPAAPLRGYKAYGPLRSAFWSAEPRNLIERRDKDIKFLPTTLRVVRCEGPYQVEEWWASRFHRVSPAFRLDMYYEQVSSST